MILIEAVLVLLVLTNLSMLGSSRLGTCIRVVALQGVALGLLPLLAQEDFTLRGSLLSLGSVALKGLIFPWLLLRALRTVNVNREVEPYVGFTLSILVGVLALGVSVWLGSRLTLPGKPVSPLVLPVALFTILVGLFVIASRRKALTQALGYLVLENGIYAFGVVLVGEIPFVVELGVLLDVFVAVLVMGVAIHHISREFDHIDADELDKLRG